MSKKRSRTAEKSPGKTQGKKGAKAKAAPRPAFAADYPRHEGLDQLLVAFEAGNYAFVREHAPRLAEADVAENVRNAAKDLRRRIDPEPTAAYLWALGVALVLLLYMFYVTQ